MRGKGSENSAISKHFDKILYLKWELLSPLHLTLSLFVAILLSPH